MILLYRKSRIEHGATSRYLFSEQLSTEICIRERNLSVRQIYVCNGLYPRTRDGYYDAVYSLSRTWEKLMPRDSDDGGFLFTGQLVTVAFWRCQGLLFMFDSHAANEMRQYDLLDSKNNVARLFRCD